MPGLHPTDNTHDVPLQPAQGLNADLIALACSLGATAAVVLPIDALAVDECFAAMCGAPHRCPSYGLAPGCPPHAMSPSTFRRLLKQFHRFLVFKIDVPATDLMGPARLPIARTIHRIAAEVEHAAQARGLDRAKGMAAGSCKELFCEEEVECVVLRQNRPCLHPDLARPSLSAVGVDFQALADRAGWKFEPIDIKNAEGDQTALGLMAGFVLLG